LFVLF
jgi:THO complex subunit 2